MIVIIVCIVLNREWVIRNLDAINRSRIVHHIHQIALKQEIYDQMAETYKVMAACIEPGCAAALLLWRLGVYEPNAGGSGIPQVKGVILGAIRMRWLRILWVKLVGGIVAVQKLDTFRGVDDR